jgi:GntR family transcriptional regulator
VLRVVRLRSDGSSPLTYTEVFVPQRFAVGVTRALLNRKPFIHVLEQCGVKVGDAEQSIAAAGAPPPIATALGIAPSAPALRIRRLLRNDAGVAVQLLHGWYRADRFEFRMQLSRAADATRVWVEAR